MSQKSHHNMHAFMPHEYALLNIHEAATRRYWLKNLWAESLDTSISPKLDDKMQCQR